MDAALLRPQGQHSNAEALRLAQLAPEILRSNPRAFSSSPLQGLFSAPETTELWTIYENLLLLCLRTGNERAAHEFLDRIVLRFSATDERCMALQGIIQEAEAKTDEDLNRVLKEYKDFLKDNDSCVVRSGLVDRLQANILTCVVARCKTPCCSLALNWQDSRGY